MHSLPAQTYTINDFSGQYCVKIIFSKNPNPDYSKTASFILSDKTGGKEHLRLTGLHWQIEEMPESKTDLSYAEQSFFIYEDFNFDGQKDIAVRDIDDACYGGKSYKIFLKHKSSFKFSAPFSDLTHTPFCGLFEIDRKNRQIKTFSKSGCCEQTTTYYRVISDTNFRPVKKISVEFNPDDSIVKKKIFYFKKSKWK